jgi:porphobilinogen synthase
MAQPKNRYDLNLRRLRQSPQLRELTRETVLSHRKLIQPLFVVEGISSRETIPGLSDVYRDTPESLLSQVEADLEKGVRSFLLFGVPGHKKTQGFDSSFTAQQIQSIKSRFGKDVFLSVDVCLCSFTAHGQCGILSVEGDHVENHATVSELAKSAQAFAAAGADCVAPSDMMDGRIAAIREALLASGLEKTLIMSYSAKFHSKFYGPFRAAADSAPKGSALKDRATYQIDPGRASDALLSSLRDAEEGADILMVKPGLPYLDVLADLSRQIKKPWAVYEVSGEYAAIELMAEKGLIAREAAHLEAWTSLTRAGASMIITYGGRHAKDWIERAYE